MPSEPPTPPADLSTELVGALEDCSLAELRNAAEYAEALADHRERVAQLDAGEGAETARPEDLPEEVPTKATVTIKEINDNRYYYWQWREGEQIKSKYKGPVDAAE